MSKLTIRVDPKTGKNYLPRHIRGLNKVKAYDPTQHSALLLHFASD